MERSILISKEDLKTIIDEAVLEAIRIAVPKAIEQAMRPRYMRKTELMALTGWSSRQVEYRKDQRTIPFIRRDRTILFPTDEIYEFLESGRVEPTQN